MTFERPQTSIQFSLVTKWSGHASEHRPQRSLNSESNAFANEQVKLTMWDQYPGALVSWTSKQLVQWNIIPPKYPPTPADARGSAQGKKRYCTTTTTTPTTTPTPTTTTMQAAAGSSRQQAAPEL